ncbi:MAG TPA: hypothetical protein VL261_01100 [Nitrospira sp.]|jgi:hypothetical protein|nr:hypothetical protein [Nitrospira sp.]
MPSIFWLGSLALTILAAPYLVSAAEPSAVPRTNAVVAAGFGFQDENTSFITVKTYNAQSGEVLSAETYELDIKDDGPPSSRPATRIFAGGLGIGSGGLSEFTLRVYDASNGRFLWEGRLNLTAGDHAESMTHRVTAHVRPRAGVIRTASRPKDAGQPYFVLRAHNPETGHLVWSDEFSTDPAPARVERISRSVIGMTGTAPREIDFRIKMPDQAGKRWLWEDKVEATEDTEESTAEQSDETTDFLRRDRLSPNPSTALPATVPSNGIATDRRIQTVRLESPLPAVAYS